MDILREKAHQVDILEDRVKKYQKKVESIPDLKKQLKSLEEQSEQYMKQKIEQEDAMKRVSLFKSQIDKYKDDITTLTADKQSLEVKFKETGNVIMML